MAEIVLDKVSKTYADGTAAVHEADFTIGDGEFFILVGPSGCGKSTLLNMIVGLEDISSGELKVDGEVVNGLDPKDRNMAMVFQSYAIYPHLTVRENIAFPLRIRKVPTDEVQRRVAEASELLELDELLDRKPANLSGGQRQRVAMGRAIVRENTAAFLMDEPLSNLDAKLRVQMRTAIAKLQQRLGTTTVYVTHDQTEALTLGDRVAVLRKGQVQQVGTPRELYNEPANLFVAGFIGSPAMNLLPARIEDDHLHLPMVDVGLTAGVRERLRGRHSDRLVAGIRPEHFEDASLVSEEAEGHGVRFTARIDVIEWMGSELYAYFTVDRSESRDELQEYAEDLGTVDFANKDGAQVVARLDAASDAAEGEELELWLDTDRVHLFDAQTGENLQNPTGETGEVPAVGASGGAAGDASSPAS
ncbi:MAG: sn-glycerol-3-phosphate ABC transporter ATP-binding protein UgpC [Actinobacteria bacterium]|nr:sn-glycerol-3-phosphate ABC transporter ATP-binding protein UgpC [Actinomycetota bacterium]